MPDTSTGYGTPTRAQDATESFFVSSSRSTSNSFIGPSRVIKIPQRILSNLRRRLEQTRWPEGAGFDDTYYGINISYLRQLVEYWARDFNWRSAEEAINRYRHFRVEVDGTLIHFMFKTGSGPHPTPLILSHGWPWTFWHWSKVIEPLTDPAEYGEDPTEAFDVIVPSLPGFGFSTPLLDKSDMNFAKIADLWHALMTEKLGYVKYAAAGCDLGALITAQLGHKYADQLYGIHIDSDQKLSSFNGDRPWDLAKKFSLPWGAPTGARTQLAALEGQFAAQLGAHILAPNTLSYGLNDSPAGMLAWLLEPWSNWSDSGGDVESVFTKDDLLTHATIYWAGNSIGTAIRTYANNARYPWVPVHDRQPVVEAPTGITFVGYGDHPGMSASERMTRFLHSDLTHWYNHVNLAAHNSGGQLIPWEIPELWVDDLRRTFRGRV